MSETSVAGPSNTTQSGPTSPVIMYGKPVAAKVYEQLRPEIAEFIARHNVVPRLAVVQVGKNPASERYIRNKMAACTRLGMAADLRAFDDDISADQLKDEVARINGQRDVHGIIVQLPLPQRIEEPEIGTSKFDIFDVIAPEKDIDGVGCEAIAALYRAQQDRMTFLACTALAVRRMIAYYGIETEGKQAVVVGRNDITAKPILHMFGGRMCNAAAIWCHRHVKPEDQRRLIRDADILVTAVGSPRYQITRDMVKPGAVIFDVATRVTESGKLTGDVDFDAVKEVASHLTPVPGGVGPMTVASLTENLFRSAKFAVGVGELGYKF